MFKFFLYILKFKIVFGNEFNVVHLNFWFYRKEKKKKKWNASNSKAERFLAKNEVGLSQVIILPTWKSIKPGRPTKNFDELSDRSKRRKTNLFKAVTIPWGTDLMILRVAGKSDASKLIKDVTVTPTKAKKCRKLLASRIKSAIKNSPSGALSLFVEADLTKRQDEIIRTANQNIYPYYSLLQQAKKECCHQKTLSKWQRPWLKFAFKTFSIIRLRGCASIWWKSLKHLTHLKHILWSSDKMGLWRFSATIV